MGFGRVAVNDALARKGTIVSGKLTVGTQTGMEKRGQQGERPGQARSRSLRRGY
jgi:hypothetical protein